MSNPILVITGMARPPVELDSSPGGDLVIAFPPGLSTETPPVCVLAGLGASGIDFPVDSRAIFAAELPINGTINGSPFELPAGRTENPVVSFSSGGTVVVKTINTGARRALEVTITSSADPGASMDPLPRFVAATPRRHQPLQR